VVGDAFGQGPGGSPDVGEEDMFAGITALLNGGQGARDALAFVKAKLNGGIIMATPTEEHARTIAGCVLPLLEPYQVRITDLTSTVAEKDRIIEQLRDELRQSGEEMDRMRHEAAQPKPIDELVDVPLLTRIIEEHIKSVLE
jgi:hypothetical protein